MVAFIGETSYNDSHLFVPINSLREDISKNIKIIVF